MIRVSKVILAVAIITAGGMASRAMATATTHIWGPSTDIQPFKLWHITSDMYVPVQLDASGSRIPTVTNVGLTVGVLPFKKLNAEVGFDHKSGLGSLDSYPLYGNVKIGVPEDWLGKWSPALAAGVFDVGTRKDFTDYNVFYVKAARTLTFPRANLGRISLGYFTGNKKLLLDENGQEDNAGILAAWERTMTEVSDKLWICLEYMGTHSGYGTSNLGASWKFAPNVAVVLGYDIFNNEALANTATIQVDVDF
ncbi:MAG: hypothetical protein WAU88_00165 [Candidatus Zixiibacteriota bacterium]